MKQKIILASESQIRKKLLLQAEVNFQSIAAKIDEDTIKESLKNKFINKFCKRRIIPRKVQIWNKNGFKVTADVFSRGPSCLIHNGTF